MTVSNLVEGPRRLFYEKDGTSVGPFDSASLRQLQEARIISGETRVRFEDQTEWQSLDSLTELGTAPQEAFYYLNPENQPIGPFSRVELGRLFESKMISGRTLVATAGKNEWLPAKDYFPNSLNPLSSAPTSVKARNAYLEALFTFLSLGLYWHFYSVPRCARDMEFITGKPRIKFVNACMLSVLTLGLFAMILSVIYAIELGHIGKNRNTPGRISMLGFHLLVGNIVAVKIALLSGGFAIVVSGVFCAILAYMLQHEFNLYCSRSAAN